MCKRFLIFYINFNISTFTQVFTYSLKLKYFVSSDVKHILKITLFNFQAILVMHCLDLLTVV